MLQGLKTEPYPQVSEEFERVARSAGAAWRQRIGAGFRQAREARAMSQNTLAELIGANIKTISEIERGLTTPSLSTAWAIADRLGLPIDIVVGRSSPEEILEALTPPAPVSGKGAPSPGDRTRIARLEAQLREMRELLDDLLKSEGQLKPKKRGSRTA